MTHAEQLAEAKAHARHAELDALVAKVQLALVEDKIAANDRAESKRQRDLVESAVKLMVKAGTIRPGDQLAQFGILEQLARDPSLVTLALQKTYRARPAVNQKTNKER